MKDKNRLDSLFDQARLEKPIVKTDHIDELIKSGKKVSAEKIKLGKAGRGLFNPLNLIIMISTIAIIVTSLFFVFSGTPEITEERQEVPASAGMTGGSNQEQAITPQAAERQKIKTERKNNKIGKSDETAIVSTVVKKPLIEEKHIPKDTIIWGQILELSREDLTRLGFEFDENGYYYLNELPDKSKINLWSYYKKDPMASAGSVGFGRGGYVNPVIKKQASKRNYYPVCTSSLFGDQLRVLEGIPSDFIEHFEYYNDTLVPVLLLSNKLGGKQQNDILAWFRVSEQFFQDLGIQNTFLAYQDIIERRNGFEDNKMHNIVQFDYSYSDLNFDNAIYLDNTVLEQLGIRVTEDSMVYRYQSSVSGVEFWFTHFGSGIQSIQKSIIKNDEKDMRKALLCAVSNLRLKMTMNVNPHAYFEVDSSITADNWIDVCIPVRFKNSRGKLWEGSTFWFYPNERLFNNLPDSIGNPMREEYNVNVAPKIQVDYDKEAHIIIGVRAPDKRKKTEPAEAVPCEYFPSFCEGLPGLDDLNVFPNPVTDNLNLEVTISREKTIDFRILDITGRLMIDDIETRNYRDAGMYRQQIDMSSLTEGFYLLVLTDDEGAKMTRRVIKN